MRAAAKERHQRESPTALDADLPRAVGGVASHFGSPTAQGSEVGHGQGQIAQQRGRVRRWDARRQVDAVDQEVDESVLFVPGESAGSCFLAVEDPKCRHLLV
jgi:hypothetical protein